MEVGDCLYLIGGGGSGGGSGPAPTVRRGGLGHLTFSKISPETPEVPDRPYFVGLLATGDHFGRSPAARHDPRRSGPTLSAASPASSQAPAACRRAQV